MTLFQRLSLLWKRLTPLEEQLSAAIRMELPQPAVPTFDAQVASIAGINRSPHRNEIILHLKMGSPSFPCIDEIYLAEVCFTVGNRTFKASSVASKDEFLISIFTPTHSSSLFPHETSRRRLLSSGIHYETAVRSNRSLSCRSGPRSWKCIERIQLIIGVFSMVNPPIEWHLKTL